MGWAARLTGDAKRTERLLYLKRVAAGLSDAQIARLNPELADLIRPSADDQSR